MLEQEAKAKEGERALKRKQSLEKISWYSSIVIFFFGWFYAANKLWKNERYRLHAEKVWVGVYRYIAGVIDFEFLPYTLAVSVGSVFIFLGFYAIGWTGHVLYYLSLIMGIPGGIIIAGIILSIIVTIGFYVPGLAITIKNLLVYLYPKDKEINIDEYEVYDDVDETTEQNDRDQKATT